MSTNGQVARTEAKAPERPKYGPQGGGPMGGRMMAGQGTGETRGRPVDHGDVGQDVDELGVLGRQDLVDDVGLDQGVVAVGRRHHLVGGPVL